MTIQEAYKSLSLARGAAQDRVEQQYKKLKSEFEQKQSNSKSSKLTDIYKSRLLEIEDAYEVLNHYLKTETNFTDYPDESNSMTLDKVTEKLNDSNDGIKINISRQKSKIWLLYSVIFIIVIAVLFSVFKEDPFEVKEGERRTLSTINLREYPDEDANVIRPCQFGSRLLLVELVDSVISNNLVWKKVQVMDEENGWSEAKTGWMAVSLCNSQWLCDETQYQKSKNIFGNQNAEGNTQSHSRLALINYFDQNYLFTTVDDIKFDTDWKIYGNDKNEKLQNSLNISNRNDEYCGKSKLKDFICLIENKKTNKQKILIFRNTSNGMFLVFDTEVSNCNGFKKADHEEKFLYSGYDKLDLVASFENYFKIIWQNQTGEYGYSQDFSYSN